MSQYVLNGDCVTLTVRCSLHSNVSKENVGQSMAVCMCVMFFTTMGIRRPVVGTSCCLTVIQWILLMKHNCTTIIWDHTSTGMTSDQCKNDPRHNREIRSY
jgi:hypothetical protein